MLQSEHISQSDLLELLNADGDPTKTRELGDHLHECEQCRMAFDALTADSEIWDKAALFLKEDSMADELRDGIVEHEPTSEFAGTNDESPNEAEWQYPLGDLLDAPRHPEMLGRIGKYDIEREVGRGGMGIVFKAHDAELNRPLAIKILAPHLASHGTARKRFAQEAIAAAGVIHPNVIAVHGVNNEGKTPYIVMPYVPGPSLQTLVDAQGPLSELEIVRIALQISSGLVAAHSQGLVHRDIKPANILVEADVNRVLITDFGLARAEDDASLTRTGWLTGTPNYMSPEQARGERPDQRSDLFSFGSLLYFIGTGRLPFRAETPLGVLNRIQNESPKPIRQVNTQVSETLSDVIEKLLKKDPAERFQSAAELHDLLERHLTYLHQPDSSKPPQVFAPKQSEVAKTKFGNIAKAFSAVGIAAAAFGLMAYSGMFDGEKPSRIETSKKDSANTQQGLLDESQKLNLTADYEASENEHAEETSNENTENKIGESLVGENLPTEGNQTPDGNYFFNQGFKLYEAEHYDEAIKMFKQAAAFPEKEAISSYNIGCIWALQKQPDKAFPELETAVDTGYMKIIDYLTDDDLESIRSDVRFKKLIQKLEVKLRADDLLNKAINVAKEERYTESEDLCRKALGLDPKNASIFNNLGYAIHMQGNYKEALKWHEKTSRSKHFADLGNYNICCVKSLEGDLDTAFRYLDAAFEAGLSKKLSVGFLDRDTDLDNLRDDERYDSALEKFEGANPSDRRTYYMGYSKQEADGEEGSISFTNVDSIADMQQFLNVDSVNGDWKSERTGRRIRVTVSQLVEGTEWEWGISNEYERGDFSPAISKTSKEFALEKKFGTVNFKGAFANRIGSGSFIFEPSETYRAHLAEQGIKDAPDALLFRLFFGWDDEDETVENLKALQELGLSKKTLRMLMLEGVKAKRVKAYQNADLDIENHLAFLIWRVEPKLLLDYIRAGMDPQKFKSLIRRRIPVSLVSSYQKAGLDLKANDEFLNSRVQPQLLKKYSEAGLDLKKHKKFINWRIEPKLLESYISAGISIEKESELISARVPAKLMKAYLDAGFDLSETRRFLQKRTPIDILLRYKNAGLDLNAFESMIAKRMPPKEVTKYLDRNKKQ